MKPFYLNILLLIICFYSCKQTTSEPGQVIFHIDSLNPYKEITSPKEEVEKFDTCVLRFGSDFNNDTVGISPPNRKTIWIPVNTDKSLSYATSYSVKKEDGEEIKLTINNQLYTIPINKKYLYIDIRYSQTNKVLDVYYSNTILVLM